MTRLFDSNHYTFASLLKTSGLTDAQA